MNYDGPGLYQHYKGGEYAVLGLALNENTMETVVVYMPTHFGLLTSRKENFWVRPLEDFNACVETEGGCVPRFELVASYELRATHS